MASFSSVSIVLPVVNETDSLIDTINVLDEECGVDIVQYILVVSDKTSPKSLSICLSCANRFGAKVRIHRQTLPKLGGAIREAFAIAQGSHVVIMSSNLETDPHQVKNFIREAKNNPNAIISATRWRSGGDFVGYGHARLVANWFFQKIFSLLYSRRLTDFTYGFRLFPTLLVKQIKWEELERSFLIETLLKPLKLGVSVVEIPSVWSAPRESKQAKGFWTDFGYLGIGLRILSYDSEDILLEKR